MRISDWSSDVCSSDLSTSAGHVPRPRGEFSRTVGPAQSGHRSPWSRQRPGWRPAGMTERAKLTFYDRVLRPDPSRTVVRPFEPSYPRGFDDGPSRTQETVDQIGRAHV